jgi:hypothetical protein
MVSKELPKTHECWTRSRGEEPRKGDDVRYVIGEEPHDSEVVGKERVNGKTVFVMKDGNKVALFQIQGTWWRKRVKSEGNGDGAILPLLVMASMGHLGPRRRQEEKRR